MATITFPVPSTTTSRFAVAAESMPDDLAGVLHRIADGPYHAHIAGRLGSSQLHVAQEQVGSLRWDPGLIKAARPEDRPVARAFNDAAEFAVITAFAPITDQPRGVQVARAAAHALAEATGGIAADLVTGHILPPSTGERTRFVLADHWLGDVLPPSRANGRCTAADPPTTPRASTAAPAYAYGPATSAASASRTANHRRSLPTRPGRPERPTNHRTPPPDRPLVVAGHRTGRPHPHRPRHPQPHGDRLQRFLGLRPECTCRRPRPSKSTSHR